jgi:hypothetical protein
MSESLQRLAPIARDATDVQLGCGAFSRSRVGQSVGQLVVCVQASLSKARDARGVRRELYALVKL